MSSPAPDSLFALIVSLHCRTTLAVSSPRLFSWKIQPAPPSAGSAWLSETARTRGLLPTLAAFQQKQMQNHIQHTVNKPIKQIPGTTIVNITYNNPGYLLRRKPYCRRTIIRTFPELFLADYFNFGCSMEWLPVFWNILILKKPITKKGPSK